MCFRLVIAQEPPGVGAVRHAVWDELGTAHDRTFAVQATSRGKEIGSGVVRSKKDAEQEAAQSALEAMAK